ncbi:MAG: hypothetical protein H6R23_346, partial [Proteobacteria bacterium]|nr:hypothetical protein [Pseudomonadota bacterium]
MNDDSTPSAPPDAPSLVLLFDSAAEV